MAITLPSFISSAISITLLIGILFLIIRNHTIMSRFGLGCIYLLVLLILLRGFIPVEFYAIKLTTSIYSGWIYKIRTLSLTHLFNIGSFSVTPIALIYLIWFSGSFIYLLRILLEYIKWKKIIYTFPEVDDPEMVQCFNSAWNKVYPQKKSSIKLVTSDCLSAPAIWGSKNPVILLPNISYTIDELYFVFVHEILHYKHKDFLIKRLVDLLVTVHWWNPIISRLLFSVVNQIQELLVDYHITKQMDKDEKCAYMATLTKTLSHNNMSSSKIRSSALVDSHNKPAIHQRLQYITEHSVKRMSFFGSVLFFTLFILSFTFVFEAFNDSRVDENGDRIFWDDGEHTYYIKNGDKYDLYMLSEFLGTVNEPLKSLKDVPIYLSEEDVPWEAKDYH